jgi:hypothetical protein
MMRSDRATRGPRAAALVLAACAVLALAAVLVAAAPESDAEREARRHFSLVEGEVKFDRAPGGEVTALLHPRNVAADAVKLEPREWVIGVSEGDSAYAYPLRALAGHEVVNDWIAGHPVAVTWCPASASAAVYVRSIGERSLTIGVSGEMWRGHRVLFDAETRSLWSQILGECLQGDLVAQRLGELPSVLVRWDDWRRAYPETRVLDPRDARPVDPFPQATPASPHLGYEPAANELVAGVLIGRTARAYPFEMLRRAGVVEDRIGRAPLVFFFDRSSGAVAAYSRRVSGLEVHFAAPTGDGTIHDLGTWSLWDWVRGEAVDGKMKGVSLTRLAVVPATWSAWKSALPGTDVYTKGAPPAERE